MNICHSTCHWASTVSYNMSFCSTGTSSQPPVVSLEPDPQIGKFTLLRSLHDIVCAEFNNACTPYSQLLGWRPGWGIHWTKACQLLQHALQPPPTMMSSLSVASLTTVTNPSLPILVCILMLAMILVILHGLKVSTSLGCLPYRGTIAECLCSQRHSDLHRLLRGTRPI